MNPFEKIALRGKCPNFFCYPRELEGIVWVIRSRDKIPILLGCTMTEILQPKLLSWGSVGIVYKVTEHIAVKRAFVDDNKGVRNEYRIYDFFDSVPKCPNLVQSFYRIPSANFLQYLSGGTLDERLRRHQKRDPVTDLVSEVTYKEGEKLVWRWMAELIDAIAWLESLGYAHGDIRPPNLLLDNDDHLKVIDFDNTIALGTTFDGCQPPYARVLGDEASGNRGAFGYHGPRTEQFAIGSVFYYMTRGYEPYDNEWLGDAHGPTVVGLLQEMKFPTTDDSDFDTIIRKCWHGEYELIRSLKLEVMRLGRGIGFSMAKAMGQEEYEARQRECRQLVENGVLDDTPRGQ